MIKNGNKRYFGITIGPISRIAMYARAVRCIWASSFFFSWISKEIVKNLMADKDGIKKHEIEDFLKPLGLPNTGEDDTVGRFPDQYIFRACENETLEMVRKAIDDALETCSEKFVEIFKTGNKDSMQNYLRQNLRISAFELECSENEVFEMMHSYMGVLDCQESFQPVVKDEENYFQKFFYDMEIAALRDFFFPNKSGDELLPGFINMDQIDEKKQYVAFVAADGDNFGKNIKFLAEHLNTKDEGSKSYYDKMKDLVEDFGGQMVFQGGDDMLFYVPLRGKGSYEGKDIFHLLSELDKTFKKYVIDKALKKEGTRIKWNGSEPTLSYGMAMSYYKYPMNETREDACNLLEEIKHSGRKNAIKWKLRKHSGQSSTNILYKDNATLYDNLKKMSEYALKNKDEHVFLHSLTHGVIKHRNMIEYILSQKDDSDQLLDSFFGNLFNDLGHYEFSDFIKLVKDILLDKSFVDGNSAVNFTHALLRYVELLIREEKKPQEQQPRPVPSRSGYMLNS